MNSADVVGRVLSLAAGMRYKMAEGNMRDLTLHSSIGFYTSHAHQEGAQENNKMEPKIGQSERSRRGMKREGC